MTEIKAFAHDWDGTVCEGIAHYSQFYFHLAEHFDLPEPTMEGLRRSWGQSIPLIAHDQWPHLELETVREMVNDFLPLRTDEAAGMIPGTVETMQLLAGEYLLGVLSSGNMEQIMKQYRANVSPDGLIHEIIVAPPTYHVDKKDIYVMQPVLAAFEARGIGRENVAYGGDNLLDQLAAFNSGVPFIAVLTDATTREEFLANGVPSGNILETFNGVPELLAGWK